MHWVGTKPFKLHRAALYLAISLASVGIAIALDRWVLATLNDPKAANEDWNQMFRSMGYLPLWILLGFALIGCDWPRRPRP